MSTCVKVKKLFKKFIQILYVDDCNCINCDKEIPKGSKYGLCTECLAKLSFNNGNICRRCGRPVDNEAFYCLECQNHPKSFEMARSPMRYKDDVSRLLLNYKFHNKKYLAKYFAEPMCDCYLKYGYDCDLIIPVPLSGERKKERGYNQAELMAESVAKTLGIPLVTNACVKILNNPRQSELSARARHENVIGAYKITDKSVVKGKKVLLIDDVLTTGSTTSEVARKLYIAGAESVKVLTYAVALEKIQMEEYDENSYLTF